MRRGATVSVTLKRTITGVLTTVTTQDADKTFHFDGIVPGDYTVQASGPDIVTTGANVSLTIKPEDPKPTLYNLPVVVNQNSISGSVRAPTGKSDTPLLNGVPVDLGQRTPTATDPNGFTVATGTDGLPLTTKTATVAGSPGQFVNTVPPGDYVARYNAGAEAVPGYSPSSSTAWCR